MLASRSNKPKITIKGVDRTNSVLSWSQDGDKFRVVFSGGKSYLYNSRDIEIKHALISNDRAFNCFEYLKCIAEAVGLHECNAGNILLNHYKKIKYIDRDCILTSFLNGKLLNNKKIDFVGVYPFGFNISQKSAVDNALLNNLSIIEGPPGTGKTQTVLNIIANAIMMDKSVAVVSSNNSAIENVLEKLKKYEVDFIAAYLGNAKNKSEFIESQRSVPNLSAWEISTKEEIKARNSLKGLYASLNEMLLKKNKLSQIKQELDALEIEHAHFIEYYDCNKEQVGKYLNKNTSSAPILSLWLLCEKYAYEKKIPNFLDRIINRFFRGVINKEFYFLPPDVMVAICQKRYYLAKIKELSSEILILQKELEHFDFDKKMSDHSNLSAKLFRKKLAVKYKGAKRKKFQLNDLRKYSKIFIKEYPVILATTYSLRSSLSQNTVYDYVIIDEASQVDLVTGALVLSCAKNVVVVGDLKQPPNVVDSNSAGKTDTIFAKFNLPEAYRYKNHSLLSTITEIFPNAPRYFYGSIIAVIQR